jgi:hypothetical protein
MVIHDRPAPVTGPTLGGPVDAPASSDAAHRLVPVGDSRTGVAVRPEDAAFPSSRVYSYTSSRLGTRSAADTGMWGAGV